VTDIVLPQLAEDGTVIELTESILLYVVEQ
jgi:hypothetical protein